MVPTFTGYSASQTNDTSQGIGYSVGEETLPRGDGRTQLARCLGRVGDPP